MSEAQDIIANALQRSAIRHHATPRIDYDAANKLFRKQKAALTRAINSGDPERVVLACRKAVQEWDADHPCAGVWPDNWSRWQCALDDVLPFHRQVDLRDLA